MLRNIVFDIGNVLADFAWQDFLNRKGFTGEMFERVARATVLGPYWGEFDKSEWSDEQVMEAFINMDPEIGTQIHEAFDDVNGLVRLRGYAIDWICQLKKSGYHVYYLSNYARKIFGQPGDSLDFIPFTDGGILSFQEKLIKPEPAIYELLCSRYGLLPEECVFLDDTRKNVETAKSLGWQGIYFESKEQAEEEMRKLGMSL